MVSFIAPAKQQPWASSLCHSRVPHTIGELQLRFRMTFISLPLSVLIIQVISVI